MRARQAVVGAAGEQVALDLGAPGVGGDDRQRGVGAPGAVAALLPDGRLERRLLGEGGRVGGRLRGDDRRAVGRDDVADRVHHDQRADDDVTVARRRAADPAGGAVLTPAPLGDAGAAAGADPSGHQRRVGRSSAAAERGAALVGARDARRPPPRGRRSPPRGRSAPAHRAWGSPRPCSASARITPSAAASPNADPPVSTIASTCSTLANGSSTAVSRVAGAPPRISIDPTVSGREHHDGHAGGRARPVPGEDAGDVGDHVSPQTRAGGRRPCRHPPGTSRAKSMISASSSSVRSYMSM